MRVGSAERNAFQPAPITNQFQKLKLSTETNQSYVRGGQIFQPTPAINSFQLPQSTGTYQKQAVRSQKTVKLPQRTGTYQQHYVGSQKIVQPPPDFEHLQPHPGFKQ